WSKNNLAPYSNHSNNCVQKTGQLEQVLGFRFVSFWQNHSMPELRLAAHLEAEVVLRWYCLQQERPLGWFSIRMGTGYGKQIQHHRQYRMILPACRSSKL